MPNFYDLEPDRQRSEGLRRLFQYVRRIVEPYHPFLRQRYREAGIDTRRLRTLDDLRLLPIIDKDDLRADPTAFVLQPRTEENAHLGTVPLSKGQLARYMAQALFNRPRDFTRLCRSQSFREQVRRRALLEWNPVHFHASGGTTGKPVMAAYTHWELTRILPQLAGLAVLQSKWPKEGEPPYDWADRGLNLFPGAPHLAFFGSVLAKTAAGLACFDTGGGHVIPTERQIALFESGKFTALLAVPSYLVHWLRRALDLQQAGTVGPLTGLKHIVLGAEPVGNALRAAITELAVQAGAHPRVVIHETLGMTEMKWWFGECSAGSGLHLEPRHYFWELLHPETRLPVPEGEPGVLVFSHIGWRGTAFIRYWTGDLVRGGMRWSRCEHCGYTFPRIFGPICRAVKDFTKLKGTRVDLSALTATVRDTAGVRQFQISLECEDASGGIGRDRLVIQVFPEANENRQELQRRLQDRVKQATEVMPDEITWEDDERTLTERLFAKTGIKAEYVVDRRGL
ncbi:MAG: phenylacetate--CoA ligase family protein [Pirellulales bacterium]